LNGKEREATNQTDVILSGAMKGAKSKDLLSLRHGGALLAENFPRSSKIKVENRKGPVASRDRALLFKSHRINDPAETVLFSMIFARER
jgi:hypothetical protein